MIVKKEKFIIETKDNILVGRENGKTILDKIIALIESSSPPCAIPIDFENLRFIDFSSADELIGKLISRLSSKEFKDIYIYLINSNKEVEETVDAVLKLRGQNAVIIEKNKNTKILGKLNPVLKETFDYIIKEKEVSARKLADKKNIAINASSNRLTKLHRLGLIARLDTNSGKSAEQYIYHSICV